MRHEMIPNLVVTHLYDRRDWFTRAACRGLDVGLFFPERGSSATEAKAVCKTCEVKQECLDWAIMTNAKDGIFGGLSPKQRRRKAS